MRVPNVIELNSRLAYESSRVSLRLREETNRIVHTEDVSGNDANPLETLATLALKVIAEQFDKRPYLHQLTPINEEHLCELLSTDLDLQFVIPLIESESYWKRRFHDKFGPIVHRKHFGWTWKCLYLERHVRQLCEEAEDEESLDLILTLCAPYIHMLIITQLRNGQGTTPENKKLKSNITFIPILKHLPNLTSLEICFGIKNVGLDSKFQKFKLSVKDCENLGEAIQHLPHLKMLRLHRVGIKCEHVQVFVEKLLVNKTLIELDLSYCRIGDKGAKCIAKLLNVHEKLKILNLRSNRIQKEGALGLAWSLLDPEGTHLQLLDVSRNPLGHEGTVVFLRALVRQTCLQELSLAACQIKGFTATRVGKMLAVNTSLRTLDLSYNDFGVNGGMAILESMKNNTRLCFLNLKTTNIPEDIIEKIEHILKENRALSISGLKKLTDWELIKSSTNFYGE